MKNKILLLIFFFILSNLIAYSNYAVKAQKGLIDFSNEDFKDQNFKLNGEWQFIWNSFVPLHKISSSNQTYMTIPDVWKNKIINNKNLPGTGFATFRLKVVFNYSMIHKKMALEMPALGTAYKLFIDGKLICSQGRVGTTKNNSKAQYLPHIAEFNLIKDTTELVLWISNFHYTKGGIWTPIYIGLEENIRIKDSNEISLDFFIAGGLMIFFIILLSFYYHRPDDKASLYFGVISLLGFIRIISTGKIILLRFIPNLNWELLIKLELISFALASALLVIYIDYIFPKVLNKYLKNFQLIFSSLASLTILLSPAIISSAIVNLIQIELTLIIFALTLYFYKIIKQKLEGAIIFTSGVMFFVFSTFNEFLFHNNFTTTLIMPWPLGLFTLFFTQAIFLSRKFSQAYSRIENFSKELENTVIERTSELTLEKDKSEKLLLNVLPEPIAIRLKEGEKLIADHFEEVSIVFIDIVDFTLLSSRIPAGQTVDLLNYIFTKFDKICEKYDLEKIKTIGDSYMAAAGIPIPDPYHAEKAALFAIEAMDEILSMHNNLQVRIGIDCGPVVAGVIGEKKFIYDLWGDSVNTAARMEDYGNPGEIHVTEHFKNKLNNFDQISFVKKGITEIKGKGSMETWFMGRNPAKVSPSLESDYLAQQ